MHAYFDWTTSVKVVVWSYALYDVTFCSCCWEVVVWCIVGCCDCSVVYNVHLYCLCCLYFQPYSDLFCYFIRCMEFSENDHICHRDVLFCNLCCDFMLLFTFCKVHAWWDHLLVETCRVNVPLMQISHNLVFCSSWVKIKFIFFFTHKKDQNVLCSTHINGNKSNKRSLANPTIP